MAIVTQQENKINKLEYYEFQTHPENAAVRDTVTGASKMLCFGEEEKQQGKAIVNAANNFEDVSKTLLATYEYFSKFGFNWEGRTTALGQFILADMRSKLTNAGLLNEQ